MDLKKNKFYGVVPIKIKKNLKIENTTTSKEKRFYADDKTAKIQCIVS